MFGLKIKQKVSLFNTFRKISIYYEKEKREVFAEAEKRIADDF